MNKMNKFWGLFVYLVCTQSWLHHRVNQQRHWWSFSAVFYKLAIDERGRFTHTLTHSHTAEGLCSVTQHD